MLPRTRLGMLSVGGESATSLKRITPTDILPAQLTLQYDKTKATYTTASLGITADASGSTTQLHTGWHWLPLLHLLIAQDVPVVVRVDHAAATAATTTASVQFRRPALGRHIGLAGTAFVIQPAVKGHELDKGAFLPSILHALQYGHTSAIIRAHTTTAPLSDENQLNSNLSSLRKQLDTPIGFTYQNQMVQVPKSERSHWFIASGTTMITSEPAIKSYLARQFHVAIANPNDLATATAYAVSHTTTRTFRVVPAGPNTIIRSYCTATRDVDSNVLGILNDTLALTYNDVRGWNNEGTIAFEHVTSGCEYTVWMSSAAQVTSFGAICDNYYNCQVGTNVIMNYDRWTSATPPWNKTGGTMQDYHTLMINHETGHRLGFADNPTCPAAGDPAPVMMQQSIDLKGCVFNIWPRPAEFSQLNRMLGLE
ncbi:MAG TPA: DUF3152 domain-containing protein [Candidatus Saccharimonadales bacterium]|nr:DUF3152 domain-containing protein [Candidatus Saccharimonadales bacterium]